MLPTQAQTHIALNGNRVPCNARVRACPRKGHEPAMSPAVQQLAQEVQAHAARTVPPTPRRPKAPMYLHGTNTLLPRGTIITAAGTRGAATAYTQSDPGAVYATHTHWAEGTEHANASDLHNPMWRHEDVATAKIDAPTMALASAMRYGVNTAANRGISPDSRSQLLASYMIDGALDGDNAIDGTGESDADVERYNRNLPSGAPRMLTDAQWAELSKTEQAAFNDTWAAWESTHNSAPPLRGYWVYKVEPVKGEAAIDTGGHAHADMILPGGALKIVDVIVWDGILVSEEFDAPPALATYPQADEQDMAAINTWRTATDA
jgi:hypothetical protein